MKILHSPLVVGLSILTLCFAGNDSESQEANQTWPKRITAVEGITEYQLENGLQVLLFPDNSKPLVTVNLTIFVGSKHEGYGEAGMAHLLEHMLFKGTPNHKSIPKLLQDRGADFNGTTWLDRTNYYETLPSEKDNLEFAIRLEADRMVNSYVNGEDLLTEMTVVRNEFEQGENSPESVLQERMLATSFLWHNYGKSTIGNRSDIERVPIQNLQQFYRKHYRPDNAMLVVAGKFDTDLVLKTVQQYFGILENPKSAVSKTYTEEPPQDGERQTVVRRVGENQHVGVLYHIPCGSDPEYPAVEVLTNILATEPSGRLYQSMVVPKIASSVYGSSFALHDPGVAFFGAVVPKTQSLEQAKLALIESVEGFRGKPITKQEVDRSITELLKQRELHGADSTTLATELSEWAAQGDWRLYFLFRDRLEQVSVQDVQNAAEKYFVQNNRTVGLFIPVEKSEKVNVPSRRDIRDMLADYQGRSKTAEGESFEPSPENIQSRLVNGVLPSGIRYSFLPKRTRGETVSLLITLRFGDERTMFGRSTAIEMLGPLLTRGTEKWDYQSLKDLLDQMRADMQVTTQPGLLQLRLNTKRQYLSQLVPVIEQILRKPRLPKDEFEVLKSEQLTSLEGQLAEPEALAPMAVSRALNQHPVGDVRYVASLEEEIEWLKKLTVEDVRKVYEELLGGRVGELVIVGDFDPKNVEEPLNQVFSGWDSKVAYQRVATLANVKAKGQSLVINTPDKANSVYYASQHFEMRDSDSRYAGLIIGNYILGGGALSSRLADRVRQKEGLSYGIGSGVNAHPVDLRASMTIFAITNPANRDKLVSIISEEIEKLLRDGVTQEELSAAKEGFLQSLRVERSTDARIAQVLASNLFAKRDMASKRSLNLKYNRLASMK